MMMGVGHRNGAFFCATLLINKNLIKQAAMANYNKSTKLIATYNWRTETANERARIFDEVLPTAEEALMAMKQICTNWKFDSGYELTDWHDETEAFNNHTGDVFLQMVAYLDENHERYFLALLEPSI